MKYSELSVELELEGPVLTRSTSPGAIGIDAPFAKDANGHFYFPGTLIKGKLRQAWEVLREHASGRIPNARRIEELLGRRTANYEFENGPATPESEAAYLPERGRTTFTDFTAPREAGSTALRYRISIDPIQQAAQDGMLQVLESPFASGEPVPFKGVIRLLGEVKPPDVMDAVQLALRAIPALGAGRGIGFGKIKRVKVDWQEPERKCSGQAANPESGFGLSLTSDEPICVAKPHATGNLFETDDDLSGAVVKGAIAEMIRLSGEANTYSILAGHLSRIRILCSAPVSRDRTETPCPPAASIAFFGKERWRDTAFADEVIWTEPTPPAYQPDWKSEAWSTMRQYFGLASPMRQVRIRTAIDRQKRRAMDQNLFGYESIEPRGLKWPFNIQLKHVPDQHRLAVYKQLQSLLQFGLMNVGKNKARMTVEFSDTLPCRFASEVDVSRTVVVQLKSPALIGASRQWQGLSTANEVHDLYAEYFASQSDGSLSLVRHFARQEFWGGHYVYKRFKTGIPYQPWMLTCAGAVFVFEVRNATAAEGVLRSWLESGLPLTPEVVDEAELPNDRWRQWERCPFVPENGYGEVGVNLNLAWRDRWMD